MYLYIFKVTTNNNSKRWSINGKEFDTYKVGTVANSCSTMHKITAKEFELEDFSYEHLDQRALSTLKNTVDDLNYYRDYYLHGVSGDVSGTRKKEIWWQMIQLLPSSYNQRRTIMMSYEVLANIYRPDSRLHHKLDEWNANITGSFCQWIESLPYSDIITDKYTKNKGE